MTVKEVEEQTGLTRANIRFYESEGLLQPRRGSNSYRDYSPEDLELLNRIKLLRALKMPIAEIVALYKGEEDLLPAMDRRIAQLRKEQQETEIAIGICREIRRDGASFGTLDARYYLDSLAISQKEQKAVVTADVVPRPYCPWRRFFARDFDMTLLSVLWLFLLKRVFCLEGAVVEEPLLLIMVNLLLGYALLLLLEPLLLSRFGTTPGKWIMGLSVTDNWGEKLCYQDAQIRTWRVLSRGMGFRLPIYQCWRMWKSYDACGLETLEWEYDTEIVRKDRNNWRFAVLIGAHLLLFYVRLSI